MNKKGIYIRNIYIPSKDVIQWKKITHSGQQVNIFAEGLHGIKDIMNLDNTLGQILLHDACMHA